MNSGNFRFFLFAVVFFNLVKVMAMPDCEYGGYIDRVEKHIPYSRYDYQIKPSHLIVAGGKIVARVASGDSTISDDLKLLAFELKNLEANGICIYKPQNCTIGFNSYVTRKDFYDSGPVSSYVAVNQSGEREVKGIIEEVSIAKEITLNVAPITSDHYNLIGKYNDTYWYITSPYNIGLSEVVFRAQVSTVLQTKALLDKMVEVGICQPYVPRKCDITSITGSNIGLRFGGGIFGYWDTGKVYSKSDEPYLIKTFVESNICSELSYHSEF